MEAESGRPVVYIAAAIIQDEHGRFLVVRKRGTTSFMQAGGKIEAGELPFSALVRELSEELGLNVAPEDAAYFGRVEAEAANEPGHIVRAELFRVELREPVEPAAEIAEAIWVSPAEASGLQLAPLTKRHVLAHG